MDDGARRPAGRSTGAAALVDEALELARTRPSLYLAGLPGALLLGTAVSVFILAHRGPFGPVSGGPLPAVTLVSGLVVALAYAARSAVHGHVARRVARGRGRSAVEGPRWMGAAWAGLLLPALAGPASVLLVPGALVMGRLMPLPGLLLVEGRRLPDAVSACFARPRRHAWHAVGAWAVLLLLALVVIVNLLLAAVLGVFALRMLTGADTTGLARLASPANEGFLFGAVVITGVAFDPIVALVRALVFVDMTSDETGDGLERRWAALLSSRASAVAAALLLGVASFSPSGAMAQDRGGRSIEAWVSNANEGAARLRALATGWEGAETIVLAPLVPVLGDALSGPVVVPPGRALPVDPAALLRALPERIDSPDAVITTLEVADRIERAAVEAVELTRSPPGDGSARSALRAELADRRYRLAAAASADDASDGPGLQARLAALWDRLFGDDAGNPAAAPPDSAETGGGSVAVVLVAVAVVLALGALLAVLLRAATARPARRTVRAPVAPPPRSPPASGGSDRIAGADEEAARGDYRAAITSLWTGVLEAQDAAGHLRATPGRTNGDHARAWTGEAEGKLQFARAATTADGLQFGPSPPDEGGWTTLRAECVPLLGEGPT